MLLFIGDNFYIQIYYNTFGMSICISKCRNTFGMTNSKACFDLMPKLPLCTLSKYTNTTGYYNAVIV